MAEIPCYRRDGSLAAVAYLDDEDYCRVAGRPWYAYANGRTTYAQTSVGRGAGKQRVLSMHAMLVGPAPKGYYIDHIDGDGLNNRRSNLRIVDRYQNQWNRRRAVNNRSGRTGVSLESRSGKYVAYICRQRKNRIIGRFSTFDEAVAAREAAEREAHGPFTAAGRA